MGRVNIRKTLSVWTPLHHAARARSEAARLDCRFQQHQAYADDGRITISMSSATNASTMTGKLVLPLFAGKTRASGIAGRDPPLTASCALKTLGEPVYDG